MAKVELELRFLGISKTQMGRKKNGRKGENGRDKGQEAERYILGFMSVGDQPDQVLLEEYQQMQQTGTNVS